MPSEYPRITNGLGKFTPEVFNRLMLMLQDFEEKSGDAIPKSRKGMQGRKTFIGKITHEGTLPGKTNQFKYKVSEVTPDDFTASTGNFTYVAVAGGISDMPAFNTVESQNTGDFAGPGVDLSAADFPSGMSLQEVKTNTIAICHIATDQNGLQVALFTIANAIDGSCS